MALSPRWSKIQPYHLVCLALWISPKLPVKMEAAVLKTSWKKRLLLQRLITKLQILIPKGKTIIE